ncbi:MAG TPA: methylated-DNA--[protein]-cysteine S-methyltransferase [Phycisphaerae bacterium]|nr:methylated-DNA--[protein]-cysteine S-methyltransferase [Phycisphaerae bacterium]
MKRTLSKWHETYVEQNGMKRTLSRVEMEAAFARRDKAYDGLFYVCVRSTGIFCRPSCPARKPLPRNTDFLTSVRDALLAGYRPCKRCRPLDANGRPPQWVSDLLYALARAPGERLSDDELRARGIEPARARRYFRSNYGMSFQAYCRHWRLGQALADLRRGMQLSQTALKYGFESESGFRDAFRRTFGGPPGRRRMLDTLVSSRLESPVGYLEVAANSEGICLLEFEDRRALPTQWKVLARRFGTPVVPGRNEHIERLADELARYFAGELREFTVPLVIRGTPFQERVWRRLLQIPFGETLSYEGLARAVGCPGAQRAVGRANGDNRLAIVVPCHRVVQKDGQLRGYGGGLWRKQFLLDLERRTRG